MPASYQRAVPLKMRRNFRNRKIASVPVKGPAFSDPKGASRPSAEGKVSGEGKVGRFPGSRGRGPPRVFGFFLRVEKETAPPRAVAAKRKLDEIIIKCVTEKAERKERTNSLRLCPQGEPRREKK